MQHIETITVGSGGTTSIDFTSIGSEFTDLVLKVSGAGATFANTAIRFNSSSSGYTFKVLGNFANSVQAYTQAAFGSLNAVMPGYTPIDPIPSNMEAYIFSYASSTYKKVSVDWTHEINSSAQYMGITQGLWSNNDPITTVSVIAIGSGASFTEGSVASLYGVLAGSDGITTVS